MNKLARRVYDHHREDLALATLSGLAKHRARARWTRQCAQVLAR